MKGLVVGAGSIGKRHLQNLKALGVNELGVVETDAERRRALAVELKTAQFSTVETGLDWSPDFVVVATPTHLHACHALQAARRGCDVFVEKPLSHVAEGLSELSELVERNNLVSLVGCNMRFHVGPAKVKDLLAQGLPGKVLFARVQAGSYLPNWRPGSDYRTNYAAREETGGGCILDCIHEIDLTRWYLGDVQEVFCMTQHTGSLDISTEDVAALVCRHPGGAISEIHLDYVQRTYERGCQIVGERGSVFWDFRDKRVRWFDAGSEQWTTFSEPEGWELNQMYLDEMRHFVECVQSRRPTVLPIPEAVCVMQIAFAAKTSAREGRLVAIGREVLA
jgi:predicted dehydrogenase